MGGRQHGPFFHGFPYLPAYDPLPIYTAKLGLNRVELWGVAWAGA